MKYTGPLRELSTTPQVEEQRVLAEVQDGLMLRHQARRQFRYEVKALSVPHSNLNAGALRVGPGFEQEKLNRRYATCFRIVKRLLIADQLREFLTWAFAVCHLCLLREVVVVFGVINARSHQRQAFGFQCVSVRIVAERDRGSPGHEIGPGRDLTRSREQESAAAWQNSCHSRY